MTLPRTTKGATSQAAQPDNTIYITRFADFTAHDGELLGYPSWGSFFIALRNSTEGEDDNSVWSPSVFRDGFRRSTDVERVACMVLRYPSGQAEPSEAFEFWSEEAFGGTTTCFVYATSEFTSPKPAFCVVVPFATPISREAFPDVSSAIVDVAARHGHEVSAASRDLAVTCSWATSRARCLGPRDGSRLLNTKTMIPDVPPAPASSSARKGTSSFPLDKWLAEIRSATPADAGKALNKNAFIAGLRIAKGNLDEVEASNDLIKAGVDAGVAEAKAAKVVQHAIQSGKEKSAEQGEKWDDSRLKRNKSGAIDGGQVSNVILILKEHPSWKNAVRYSDFDQRIHLFAPPFAETFYGGTAKPTTWLEDNDLTCIRAWLEMTMEMSVSQEIVLQAVVAVGMRQSFHQVREWLDRLVWDGTPRLDTWLETYCGAEVETDSQKIAVPAMSKRWMISAVARAFDPGAKVDCTLVLEGEQSIKKSTTFATLVPKEAWFSDEKLNLDSKDTLQQIQGKWIIEIGELASFKGKANEEIKHFLTKRADDFRIPWGKINKSYPRQCVFGGTVNDSEYLNDPTGNRRFFPVRCHGLERLGGKIDIDGLRKVRDQLWAEAVHLYRQDEQWWLTEEEDEAAKVEQEARFTVDAWEAKVIEWLETYDAAGNPQDKFTMGAVLHGAVNVESAKQGRAEQTRMKNILTRLGFKRRQVTIGDERPWRYCKRR